ncbi:MAG: N-acetylmuramoyl-L-alanine amidase [Fimbriimonas sp.]
MKSRILLTMIPWMGLVASAWGQTRMVEVVATHLGSIPQRAFRVGDECFVPIENLANLGWQASGTNDVEIRADGRTVKLLVRVVAGQKTVPVRKIVQEFGGASSWTLGGDTLEVASVLQSIRVDASALVVKSSFAVKPSLFTMVEPDRVVIDLPGTRLPEGGLKDVPAGLRVSQHQPNVVRIVREDPAIQLPSEPIAASTDISLPLTPAVRPQPAPVAAPTENPPAETEAPPEVKGIFDLSVQKEDAKVTRLQLKATIAGKATLRKPSPDVLEIFLPKTFARLPEDFALGSPSVLEVKTVVETGGTVLRLSLSRPMGAEVFGAGGALVIQLTRPDVGDGQLAGKIIVIDPGHGGKDKGAKMSPVLEKDIVLAVSKNVAALMQSEGATVVMTRKDDTFVPLTTRADLAKQNRADLFVSIHVNSNRTKNSRSGTISFHHESNTMGQLLAECIQREIVKVSGLPGIGTWSDAKIYDSGFSVLRNTFGIPGVLLELGFINHDRDRKRMIQQDFQSKVAKAIVQGVKVYLGNGK